MILIEGVRRGGHAGMMAAGECMRLARSHGQARTVGVGETSPGPRA